MKRRALLLWLAAAGCRARDGLEVGRALVAAAAEGGLTDAARGERCLAELGRFCDTARSELASGDAPRRGRALAKLLFERWGFVREVSDESLAFVLLPSVVERRRGSCVGLGSLFLALADELGIPASGVLMPGHFYVRVGSAESRLNLELLRSGEVMPDAWYLERYPIRGGQARAYGRALSTEEVLGVVAYDVGNERRRQRRLAEARKAYSRAAQAFPDFAEAHASLGAVEQLLGDAQAAAACYRRAREAYPSLPGVNENLALLEAERAGRL